jgi:hypothetical protein
MSPMTMRAGSYLPLHDRIAAATEPYNPVEFHAAPALPKITATTLDGVDIAAENPKSGDMLHGPFSELGDRFGFFLPAAGKERYRVAEENPVDVKVAGKLAKLYIVP